MSPPAGPGKAENWVPPRGLRRVAAHVVARAGRLVRLAQLRPWLPAYQLLPCRQCGCPYFVVVRGKDGHGEALRCLRCLPARPRFGEKADVYLAFPPPGREYVEAVARYQHPTLADSAGPFPPAVGAAVAAHLAKLGWGV